MAKQLYLLIFIYQMIVSQTKTNICINSAPLTSRLISIYSIQQINRLIQRIIYIYIFLNKQLFIQFYVFFFLKSFVYSQSIDACIQAYANGALRQHNEFRARHGAPPLRLSPDMTELAQNYANKLAKINRLTHNPSLSYNTGENLALNWYSNVNLDANFCSRKQSYIQKTYLEN